MLVYQRVKRRLFRQRPHRDRDAAINEDCGLPSIFDSCRTSTITWPPFRSADIQIFKWVENCSKRTPPYSTQIVYLLLYIILCHITSYHITSHHIISLRITSHNIISQVPCTGIWNCSLIHDSNCCFAVAESQPAASAACSRECLGLLWLTGHAEARTWSKEQRHCYG